MEQNPFLLENLLTPLEFQISKLVAEGYTNIAIASELTYERGYIQNVLTNIYRKLELKQNLKTYDIRCLLIRRYLIEYGFM